MLDLNYEQINFILDRAIQVADTAVVFYPLICHELSLEEATHSVEAINKMGFRICIVEDCYYSVTIDGKPFRVCV